MIRRLRRRLVTVSMLSLTGVLALFLIGAAVVHYHSIVINADKVLALLAENGGHFPKSSGWVAITPPQDDETEATTVPTSSEKSTKTSVAPPPEAMGFSPELPYEARFFSVRLYEDGTVYTVDTGRIAAVDTNTAIDYAKDVYQKKKNGFIGQYRYTVTKEEDGKILILFLDCRSSLETFRKGQITYICMSTVGLACIFGLIVLFSARIVRPMTESYEKQKRFITDAGHEMKTPLSIISADAEVLLMDDPENEWLTDIQSQTERLAELTKHLITLSRMEETDTTLSPMIDFPFSDLVGEIAHSFETLATHQGKDLLCDIMPNITLCGDEKAIRELLSILLDNAIKYSTQSGIISLSLRAEGKNAVLCVKNPAEGLTAESVSRFFERFYRGDESHNSSVSGSGIGLSVAKAITERHKGTITASTETGAECTLTVILPNASCQIA